MTKGIPNKHIECKSSLELSSDHSPVSITLTRKIQQIAKPCRLHNLKTNYFRQLVASSLNTNLTLKSDSDIEDAVEHCNNCMQKSARETTPETVITKSPRCSLTIREKLTEKSHSMENMAENKIP